MKESKITTLVIASHNRGKIKEIAELLIPFGLKIIASPDLDLVNLLKRRKLLLVTPSSKQYDRNFRVAAIATILDWKLLRCRRPGVLG